MCDKPIPVAARSQVWVCGRSLALGLRVRIPPWARMSIPLDVVCCDGLISRPEEFYRVCVGEKLENCSIPAQGKLSHLPAYCPQTPVPVPSLILDPSVNQTNPLTAGAATLPLVQSSLVSIVTLYLGSKFECCPHYVDPHINTFRTGSFKLFKRPLPGFFNNFNPLNAELNPICYLLALLAHHFLHFSRKKVKSLTLRLLMSYIYIWSTHS